MVYFIVCLLPSLTSGNFASGLKKKDKKDSRVPSFLPSFDENREKDSQFLSIRTIQKIHSTKLSTFYELDASKYVDNKRGPSKLN